jgi:CRISPR-associated protein Cas5/CasD subtype I-E
MGTPLRGVALRLHGPMQAWGGASIGDDRPTLPFPTRSGVLGLLAACLGIPRRESAELLALARGSRVHIRVDAPGQLLVDDQTIQGKPNASEMRQTIQSKRTYLCDASFVAMVVPGPGYAPEALAEAVARPKFAPFLGRRCCIPSTPLLLKSEVVAEDALGLFTEIALGPEELLRSVSNRHKAPRVVDFYLDVASESHALRRIPVRDDLCGPLPRQYRERFAYHVQRPYQEAGT